MMSEQETKLMSDEEILKGLKREAVCTVAPERMRLYGDAYARIDSLTAEVARLREGLSSIDKTSRIDPTDEYLLVRVNRWDELMELLKEQTQ